MEQYKFIIDCECVLEHHGKLLVIERPSGVHGGGLLAFPGGKFESTDGGAGDALRAAARRELYEETGISFEGPLRYVTSNVFPDSKNGVMCVAIIFHGVLQDLPVLTPSQREVVQYHWLTREELITHPQCPPWMVKYAQVL